MTRAERALQHIFDREGGYVDHPADRGGPTNYGITIKALAHWLGVDPEELTADDIQALTKDAAAEIYQHLYIDGPGWEALQDEWTFLYAVDCNVNHGQRRATRILQAASGSLAVDGIFGPKTLATVNALSTAEALRCDWPTRVRQERMLLYVEIAKRDPSQLAFLEGWTNRAFSLLQGNLTPSFSAPSA